MNALNQAIPGPYAYTHNREGVDDVLNIASTVGDRPHVASINFWNECDPATNGRLEATARLLAAAPELRDGLRRLLDAVESIAPRGAGDDELTKAVASAHLVLDHVHGPKVIDESSFLIPTDLNASEPSDAPAGAAT